MTKRNVAILVTVLVLVFCLPLPRADATVIFDDGGIHDIGYQVNDSVEVRDDTFFDRITTVNLLPGGSIRWSLIAYQRSLVTVSGGSIGSDLLAYNTSQVTVSGGSIGSFLQAYDSSQVTVSGGSVNSYLWVGDSSQVTVSGGSVWRWLVAEESSQVTVSAGSIKEDLFAEDSSQVTVSGGSIDLDLIARGTSDVTISGGSIGGEIFAGHAYDDNSLITFVGRDFAINSISVGYGEFDTGGMDWVHGTLTGTLADGDPLNNGFYIYGDSSIVLVPEPATLSFLALGSLALLKKRKGHKQYSVAA